VKTWPVQEAKARFQCRFRTEEEKTSQRPHLQSLDLSLRGAWLATPGAGPCARHARHPAVERRVLVVLAGHVAIAREPPCCIWHAMELTRELLPLAHGIAPRHPLLEESRARVAAAPFSSQLGLVAHRIGCCCRAHRQGNQGQHKGKGKDGAMAWHEAGHH